MKISTKPLLLTAALVISTFLVAPSFLKATPTITHPQNAEKYRENPTPNLQGNENAPAETQAHFLTREEAIKIANIPVDAKLVSAKKTNWGTHVHEDLEDQGPLSGEVAKDRVVWVVKVDYPNGVDTKGGFYANAHVILTIDAETGRVINGITSGDLKEVHSHGK